MRGSGWYYVKDFSEASSIIFRSSHLFKFSDQYYNWGYLAGCNYFGVECPAVSELYCKKTADNQNTCAGHYYGKGRCASTNPTFTPTSCDYYSTTESSCMVANSATSPEATEVYGPSSRCIDYKSGSTYSARCHSVSCSGSGSSQVVTITVGSSSVTCTQSESGTALKNVGGLTIECPYVTRLCGTLAAQCPADCNGRGYCSQEKKCFCFTGWSGTIPSQVVIPTILQKFSFRQSALTIFASGTSCETAAVVDYEKITFNEDKKNCNVFKLTVLMLTLLLLNVFA